MKTNLLERNLHGPGRIRVSKTGCLGRCSSGPCMVIYPEGTWYNYSTFSDIDKIVQSHLIAGTPATDLLIDNT